MKEMVTAGPAFSAAASPVNEKIPAPMIAPTPSVTRLKELSVLFNVLPAWALSASILSILFVLNMTLQPSRPPNYDQISKILSHTSSAQKIMQVQKF